MKLRLISTVILILGLLAAPAFMGASTALAADDKYNGSYEALFEIFPDDICWTEESYNGNASFDNGVLKLDTGSSDGNSQLYTIYGSDLVSPDPNKLNKPWIIEANAKYVSGVASHVARRHMHISFTPFSDLNLTNSLMIGQDEIFLLSDDHPNVRGETYNTTNNPNFDTDGAFHTYRIEVSYDETAINDWRIHVYYDDGETAVLTGSLLNHSPWYSIPMKIAFGDGTGFASGTSYWNHVKISHYNGICGIFLP